MNVVIIGSGGREHALVWKIAQSSLVKRVFCLPGNGGTATEEKTTNVSCNLKDMDDALAVITDLQPDLVVVGPEQPLVDGLADRLRDVNLLVVGPAKAAARLEGSKVFAKELMERAGMPTAQHKTCHTFDEALASLGGFKTPPVVKADGLAAGKGVTVASTFDEARLACQEAMVDGRFGDAGRTIVLEEQLVGVEASYIGLTDGSTFAAFPTSQDHKRLLESDRGPNTGGMGAYLPNPFFTSSIENTVRAQIVEPLLSTLKREKLDYRGFLYIGLMLTDDGPKVLEFNIRAGDPETQPIMFGLEEDLVPALVQTAEGHLNPQTTFSAKPTVTIVLAAKGYPNAAETGKVISGLERVAQRENARVFHAGTRREGHHIITSGGRVLGVTAKAPTLPEALLKGYEAADLVEFEGLQFRRDIGGRA